MAGPPDPEAAPLRGGAGPRGAPASTSGRALPPPHAPRSLARAATLALAASVAASGLALWVRTGRVVQGLGAGGGVISRARVAAAPVLGTANAPGDAPPVPGDAPPAFHTAAAEWWASLVSPYPGPAREEAFAALTAQDATEAAAAATRFAAIDAAAGAAAPARPYTGDPADYELTPALLAATVAAAPPGRRGFITITWCNAAFVPFALNWAAHARAAGLAPLLVGASDEAALVALLAAGLPAFAMPRLVGKAAGLRQTSPADLGWGSPAFHALGREKAATAAAVTASGHAVLLTDVDLVFLRDPAPYFGRFPDAALLTSSDGLHRTTVPNPAPRAPPPPAGVSGLGVAVAALAVPGAGDGLEAWPAALDGADGNIGVMLWRPVAHPVAAAWRDALLAEGGAWDQAVFNDLLRAGSAFNGSETAAPAASPGLFRTFGRAAPTPAAALAGVLPVDTFASGHTHFVQRLAERTGQAPYAVHTTFQFSGTVGKRHRLRERWLWAVDGRGHYAPPGGLLTLGPLEAHPAVASALGAAGGGGLAAHFALVAAQLAVFRAGLGVAGALNRTLVLPRFWCGADRWWAGHGGVIPGATLPARVPFRCPADHVLDLAAMADAGLDAGVYGPMIPYREAGLTANPRFPREHAAPGRAGTVAVVAGAAKSADTSTTVALPAPLDDAGLRAALAPLAATPVLHVADPAAVWSGGFADPVAAARFGRRVGVSTDAWCCEAGAGGVARPPVWYDAQADVDHVDRHGVAWRGGEWAGQGP